MYSVLIFASIFAVALARPGSLPEGVDGHVAVTQSSVGTYKYSVLLRDSSRNEERLADGTIIGQYTIPSPQGPQTFKYVADQNGFRILEGPVPVAPVAPVPLQAVQVPETLNLVVPSLQSPGFFVDHPNLQTQPLVSIQDTPEVKAAREAHLAFHRAAAERV
ncbi:hypothetical protein HUJ04_010592 [Dendroctonus ponderosae]|uniref:Cuticle protein n=1 Tax=Dendroctonus ponderosae TaxID=77166 RepID=A0AAR5P6L3_DENPD|nr:hypothetical protein HUJ04_009001 [Dendroctonus ponderosae]KAH1021018.1 hypothetical protein HUJ04_010592 [Dendroctonus ponderosae]KAH1021019.1 hypothetical protein HUJ04_010592 [Dendroctonus ponderosae]